jgi:hypothetical protein
MTQVRVSSDSKLSGHPYHSPLVTIFLMNKRPLKKQLARSFHVKSNHHDSGQQPLLRLPLAAFDDRPWFNCDPLSLFW